MNGYIFQLNSSPGGVPKIASREALLTPTGLVDDRQLRKTHGGPDRALCLYSLECIMRLQEAGHPIYPGSTGENVTIRGLDWSRLEPGNRLALGKEVVIEISGYAAPCGTIAESFIDGYFDRISQKLHPGESRLSARIIQTGHLSIGQPVRVLE